MRHNIHIVIMLTAIFPGLFDESLVYCQIVSVWMSCNLQQEFQENGVEH